jgi:peptidoglycan/LPS O-acetylase OafA/YrhL
MKKLIVLLALCLAAYTAHAQMAPMYTDFATTAETTLQAPAVEFSNGAYLQLLQEQNKLLNRRNVGTIVAVSGIGTLALGVAAIVIDDGLGFSIIALGGVTTIGSAIYLGINGMKLLNNQTQINNNLILKINPSGLALQF